MKIIFLSILVILTFIPEVKAQSSEIGWIKVQGNKLVNEAGEAVVFHGVNISDPHKIERDGYWDKAHFREVKSWGANLIRIPVHPSAWRARGEEGYLRLLDEAVQWANELGLYLVIDWHSIGNLRTELYQNPMYNTTRKETFEFWLTISRRYADEPAVAFYELFNEPTTYNGQLGALNWADWKKIVEDMIQIIFANNPRAIPLVAGFNWAYDLSPMQTDPLTIPGIAFVAHPYPQKREQPWELQWERDFGFIAEKAPLLLTEIGFALPEEKGVHVPVTGDEEYGRRIVEYADKIGASWVVWVFDPDWGPMMFKDWETYEPTRQGVFFKKEMQKRNSAR